MSNYYWDFRKNLWHIFFLLNLHWNVISGIHFKRGRQSGRYNLACAKPWVYTEKTCIATMTTTAATKPTIRLEMRKKYKHHDILLAYYRRVNGIHALWCYDIWPENWASYYLINRSLYVLLCLCLRLKVSFMSEAYFEVTHYVFHPHTSGYNSQN